MGYQQVAPGEVIASAHMNLAIGQGVMRFADATDRDTQVPSPVAGMVAYLADTDRLVRYTGTKWVVLGSEGASDSWSKEIASAAGTQSLTGTGGIDTFAAVKDAQGAAITIAHTVPYKCLYSIQFSARLVFRARHTLSARLRVSGVQIWRSDGAANDGTGVWAWRQRCYPPDNTTQFGIQNGVTYGMVAAPGTMTIHLEYSWTGAAGEAELDYISILGTNQGAVLW